MMGGKGLAERIRRGREAVARAQARGTDCTLWEQRVAELEAAETALLTVGLLATQGWCLWQCQKLDGQVIAITRDEKASGVPHEVAIFTEAEMRELFRRPVSTGLLKLVLEAKRLAGARVLPREFEEHGYGTKA
ncbi:MAG: hypothetical protein Q7R39_00950 [Dehalococcoidia bacterium]|nr:hypothetical protein [Dehalococcoidia bacterium]